MKKTYITLIVLVIIVLGVLSFVFTGEKSKVLAPTNNQGSLDTNNPNQTSKVKEFTIVGKNFSFTPNTMTVKKGDEVKINFKNEEGTHDLKIDEFNVGTKTLKNGESESLEFIADKVGSFQYYCSVGTHRAMGMWGVLKVTE